MKTGSLVVMCSVVAVEVVAGVVDCVDIDSVAILSDTLAAVVGCVEPYSAGNVVGSADVVVVGEAMVVVVVYHDGFRLKYNFDKRFGDCDEKLLSSFRYTE